VHARAMCWPEGRCGRALRALGLPILTAAATLAVAAPAAAATRYVSASGSDRAACTRSAPCASLERAYRSASPGDAVEVAGGAYGSQLIPSLGRSAPAIVFRPAGAREVTVAGLLVQADHVVVRGLRSTTGWFSVDSRNPADPVEHVRFRGMHARGHWLNNARDFVWKGGSIGPWHNEKLSMIGGRPASRRITYDRVRWHDATRDSGQVHTECFLVASVQGLTIRNSRFSNCAVFALLIGRLGDDPVPRDIVIESTIFDETKDVGDRPGFYSFMTGAEHFDGFVLRNNVWKQPPALQGSFSRARMVNNVGRAPKCAPGWEYSHNVFTDHRCGRSDKLVRGALTQFVDPADGDWRPKANSALIDAGDPLDAPRADAAGRPRVGRPDAGAYEHRSRKRSHRRGMRSRRPRTGRSGVTGAG
jgi:hypothetical protein